MRNYKKGFIDLGLTLLIAGLIGVGALAWGAWKKAANLAVLPDLGAATSTALIAGSNYYLAGSGLSANATSVILTSLTIPQSGYLIQRKDLSDTFYITLEPGNRSRQEIISCTGLTQNGDGTATLVPCSRGLLPFYPYTASSTYQFAHAGGTTAIFSNPPHVISEFVPLKNDSYVTGTITLSSGAALRYDFSPVFTGSSTNLIPDINYVNKVASSGAANASESVTGLIRIASGTSLTRGTRLGSDGSYLVPSNQFFNATSSATSTIPVTNIDGTLSSGFISTSSPYSWTGAQTFRATTTLSATTTNISGNLTISGTSTITAATTSFNGVTNFNGQINAVATTSLPSNTTTSPWLATGIHNGQAFTSAAANVYKTIATSSLINPLGLNDSLEVLAWISNKTNATAGAFNLYVNNTLVASSGAPGVSANLWDTFYLFNEASTTNMRTVDFIYSGSTVNKIDQGTASAATNVPFRIRLDYADTGGQSTTLSDFDVKVFRQ